MLPTYFAIQARCGAPRKPGGGGAEAEAAVRREEVGSSVRAEEGARGEDGGQGERGHAAVALAGLFSGRFAFLYVLVGELLLHERVRQNTYRVWEKVDHPVACILGGWLGLFDHPLVVTRGYAIAVSFASVSVRTSVWFYRSAVDRPTSLCSELNFGGLLDSINPARGRLFSYSMIAKSVVHRAWKINNPTPFA